MALTLDGTEGASKISESAMTDQDIYAKDNILGTVSQSGGIPTGAIMEEGSNSNGEYVKWADGTMIQFGITGTLTTSGTWGNFFTTPADNFDYPAQFAGDKYPSIAATGASWTTYVGFCGTSSINYGQGRVQAYSASNIATCSIIWVAFGRWY